MKPGIREADDNEKIAMAQFVYRNHGPTMSHNYLCAVCRTEKAVLQTNTGILQPCWECKTDYKLIKLSWFQKFIRGLRR